MGGLCKIKDILKKKLYGNTLVSKLILKYNLKFLFTSSNRIALHGGSYYSHSTQEIHNQPIQDAHIDRSGHL